MIHCAFRLDDLRIQLPGIGHHRAILHPVPAVERQRIAERFTGAEFAFLQVGSCPFHGSGTAFGKSLQPFFIGIIPEKAVRIGGGVGVCGAEDHLIRPVDPGFRHFRFAAFDQIVSNETDIGREDGALAALRRFQRQNTDIKFIERAVVGTGIEVPAEGHSDFGRDDLSCKTAFHFTTPLQCQRAMILPPFCADS